MASTSASVQMSASPSMVCFSAEAATPNSRAFCSSLKCDQSVDQPGDESIATTYAIHDGIDVNIGRFQHFAAVPEVRPQQVMTGAQGGTVGVHHAAYLRESLLQFDAGILEISTLDAKYFPNIDRIGNHNIGSGGQFGQDIRRLLTVLPQVGAVKNIARHGDTFFAGGLNALQTHIGGFLRKRGRDARPVKPGGVFQDFVPVEFLRVSR